MNHTARLLTVTLSLFFGLAVYAHEVRPAFLEITEQATGSIEILWRQPVMGEYTIAIAPVLSSGWLDAEPDRREITDNSLIKIWTIDPPHEKLPGQTLAISGLDRTITDTLVKIKYADGKELSQLVKAETPRLVIPGTGEVSRSLPEYLLLGIDHIWSGPDHLSYILGLILLITGLRSLVMTITAFTLAHSITLACAVLGIIQLRTAPVEAVISLSIVYVAAELIRLQRGRMSLAGRFPWLIAFVFGLLHGFGFASALRDAGLPQDSIGSALLLFNLGIEAGQLMFVLLVLLVLRLLKNYLPVLREQLLRYAPYGIGSVASFWLLQRLAAIFV